MYVLCCNFYKKREKDIFKISGLILLTTLLLLNIIFLTFALTEFFPKKFEADYFYNKRYYIVLGGIALFLIIFYFRYFKITNYDEIVNKIYELNLKKRSLYWISALLYIILSVGTFFTYVIYKGGIKSGWWQ